MIALSIAIGAVGLALVWAARDVLLRWLAADHADIVGQLANVREQLEARRIDADRAAAETSVAIAKAHAEAREAGELARRANNTLAMQRRQSA